MPLLSAAMCLTSCTARYTTDIPWLRQVGSAIAGKDWDVIDQHIGSPFSPPFQGSCFHYGVSGTRSERMLDGMLERESKRLLNRGIFFQSQIPGHNCRRHITSKTPAEEPTTSPTSRTRQPNTTALVLRASPPDPFISYYLVDGVHCASNYAIQGFHLLLDQYFNVSII